MTKEDKLIRKEFPVFENRNVVYLDNSATTQKPPCVLKAVEDYYEKNNANPLRGLYELSIAATDAYSSAKKTDTLRRRESPRYRKKRLSHCVAYENRVLPGGLLPA